MTVEASPLEVQVLFLCLCPFNLFSFSCKDPRMTRLRPPPGSKVREKQGLVRLTLIWLVAVATLVVAGTADDKISIHPTAPGCRSTGSKPTIEVTCDLQSGKKYKVLNFNWSNIVKTTVYGNGSSIFLQHPMCLKDETDNKRELHIYNASKVETAERADDCALQLRLENCIDVTIVGGVNSVRMYSSHANKVTLPKVTQFDLEDNSNIGEVSLVVTGGRSELTNSTIDLVTKLDIQGEFSFKMIHCELGRVINFMFNNTHKEIQIERLTVGHVSPGGMLFVADAQLNHINFNVVEQEGIQVLQGESLTFNYGKIRNFFDGSIAVGKGATLELHNVTLGEKPDVSFKFSKASFKAYPLVFLKPPWVAPMEWIAIGVAVGLLVGFVATTVLMRFVKKGSFSVGGSETSKLLSQEEPAPQAEKQHKDPRFKKHDAPKTIPAPPNRPLPNVPGSRVSQNEYYDDVLATASPLPPSDTPHPPPIAQRPPCAIPKEQAKPSRSLNIKDRFRGKASFLPPVMKHSKQDPRDALPPPPPPDEELYDDPGDMTLQFPPQPPPASRPQQPVPPPPGKPFPQPPDGEELYDDVQDMGLNQRPPAPPPSVNKPVLAKGKPKPPPPLRKPNRY